MGSDISRAFEHIVWINLEHRKDRRENVTRQMSYLKDVHCTVLKATRMKDGFMGCTTSHIRALQTLKKKIVHYGVIMEDDFMYQNDKMELIETFLSTHPNTDVLCLSTNPWDLRDTDTEGVKRAIMSGSSSGYIIRKGYIDTLIKNMNEALAARKPLDVQWLSIQKRDNWYALYPPMGVQMPGFSDIEQKETNYGV